MHELDAKKNNSGAAQSDHLLDELKSIKDLLAGEQYAQPASVIAQPTDRNAMPQPLLLDIASIFADDAASTVQHVEAITAPPFQFPKFTLEVALTDEMPDAPITPQRTQTDSCTANLRADYRREALIQELIAEFIPQIEAALRERLEQLDNVALQALKTPS
jgi:hypothetical protein